MSIDNCRLIALNRKTDPRGSLVVVEGSGVIPFEMKRIFYIYDVPAGSARGGHALSKCEQVLIAAAGGFDVIVDDTVRTERYHLDRPDVGLYIPPSVWREMDAFSEGAVCLTIASTLFDASDYFRQYADFVSAVKPAG